MPHTAQPNPLFEQGYKGFTMLRKDGSGNLHEYDMVGVLAERIFKMLLPLRDGPFGGAGQPPARCLSAITLEIYKDPLHITTYDTIGEFKAAVDAVPAPEASTGQGAAAPAVQQQIVDTFNDVYAKLDMLRQRVDEMHRRLDMVFGPAGPHGSPFAPNMASM